MSTHIVEAPTNNLPKYRPLCAVCDKPVDRLEIINQFSTGVSYRVYCHGENEEHILGAWAASEYASKGKELPDAFVQKEPSWEEKYNRLNESLAKNKRLFSSAFAQKVIKNQVKRIEQLEDDLIAARKEINELKLK